MAIDGLDEIQGDLSWLPRSLPNCVRVVMTTRPTENWEKLKQYSQLEELELEPLQKEEITQIIETHGISHNLNLDPKDVALLHQRAAGNPLFLKVALDEIATSGIAIGQLALTVKALFDQILKMQSLIPKIRKNTLTLLLLKVRK